jgi:hypothetical protein
LNALNFEGSSRRRILPQESVRASRSNYGYHGDDDDDG